MGNEPILVFVFLDENVARMDTKIADFFAKNFSNDLDRFDLFILPFPKKAKGKPDHEVMYFIKEYIFSSSLMVSQLKKAWFVFLTRDLNFVEDVELGLNQHRGIIPAGNCIVLRENRFFVPLSVVSVRHKQNLRKSALVAAIATSLRNFLHKNL